MAMIAYKDDDGADVIIKNPSDEDMEKMWGCIARRIAPEVASSLAKDPEFLKGFRPFITA